MRIFDQRPKTPAASQTSATQTPQKSEATQETTTPSSTPSSSLGARLQSAFDKGTQAAAQLLGQAAQAFSQEAPAPKGDAQLSQGLQQQLKSAHVQQLPLSSGKPIPAAAPSFVPTGGIQGSLQQARLNQEGGFGAGPGTSGAVEDRFYKKGVTGSDLSPTSDQMSKKVDLLGDKSARMEALKGFTQYDREVSSGADGNSCGATCIVAGAVLQGGQKGLQDLVRVIEKRENKTLEQLNGKWKELPFGEYHKLPGIKERINNNTVTQQDLADLKTIVYKQLLKADKDNGSKYDNELIATRSLQDYVNTDVAFIGKDRPLKGMFDQMNIKLIDTTGDGNGNHFALFFNDGKGSGENALYDPWPQKSGSQITTNSAEMLVYHQNVKDATR